jgi:hypothetical protein
MLREEPLTLFLIKPMHPEHIKHEVVEAMKSVNTRSMVCMGIAKFNIPNARKTPASNTAKDLKGLKKGLMESVDGNVEEKMRADMQAMARLYIGDKGKMTYKQQQRVLQIWEAKVSNA